MNVTVERLVVGPYNVNCYLLENPETREALIVDPGADAERIVRALGERKPVAVLLTHGHFDHMGAADALCERYHIPLYIHRLDADKLTDDTRNVSQSFGAPLTVRTPATTFEDGQTLALAGIPLTVLHTPGHSAGSSCFLLPDGQGVLCGDTLFDGGYGRTDFPDGDFHALRQSLRKLMTLTPKQTAYPGHEGFTHCGRDAAL